MSDYDNTYGVRFVTDGYITNNHFNSISASDDMVLKKNPFKIDNDARGLKAEKIIIDADIHPKKEFHIHMKFGMENESEWNSSVLNPKIKYGIDIIVCSVTDKLQYVEKLFSVVFQDTNGSFSSHVIELDRDSTNKLTLYFDGKAVSSETIEGEIKYVHMVSDANTYSRPAIDDVNIVEKSLVSADHSVSVSTLYNTDTKYGIQTSDGLYAAV